MKEKKRLSADVILQTVFIYLTEISSLRKHDDIINVLADMGRVLTNADRCTVWVVSDDRKKIWTKVAHGIDAIEIDIDSGIVGSSIMQQKKIIIDDVYKDNRFNVDIDKQTGYKTKSMMVMPMFDNTDQIIGAFQVINSKSEEGVFDDEDMEKLMLASTYAAETLMAAKLTQEIEETQREVVFTMGAVGESRSKETGNHVKRVAEYSKILALAYGLPEDEAELLKQASPMHDIGKVAIPDSVLNKPGRFNEEERHIIETHAELGYNMIKNSERPLLKAASIVAYEHHEKWNGDGYPRKIKETDIHIYGRITAIADVFDALGSDRVYKKAWPDDKILNLFKEERGKHFDPYLVDMFFENIDKIFEVRDKFKDEYKPKEFLKNETHSVKCLGAYGTRAKGFGTSSIYINEKNVIDAGNLLGTLQEDSAKIQNIWLTHSHFDHISDIAYVLDNYYAQLDHTINIYGLPPTVKAVKKHFLNDVIWPDFSKIKLRSGKGFSIEYKEVEIGKEYSISQNETIKAFKTDHTVPSCGYIYKEDDAAILITADTYSLDNVVDIVNNDSSITSIVVECSFPSDMEKLAKESKHLTPKILSEMLQGLKREEIKLYLNHMKPTFVETITEETKRYCAKWNPKIVKDGKILTF